MRLEQREPHEKFIGEKMEAPKRLFEELDGLRGIAACTVVLFHFLAVFAPSLVILNDHASVIAATPFAIAYNGMLAVSIFFVLSGFVLANSVADRSFSLIETVGIRYVRLAVPALTSCLWALVLLRLHPSSLPFLQAFDTSNPWHDYVIPGWAKAVKDALWSTFRWGKSELNTPLWTMHIELFGSILVYVFYTVIAPRKRVLTLGMTALAILSVSMSAFFLCFVLGCAIRELHRVVTARFAGTVLGLGILLGSPMSGLGRYLHLPPGPRLLELGSPAGIMPQIAAAMIVTGVLGLVPAQRFLKSGVPAFLGRMSFPLYLLHWPILLLVGSIAQEYHVKPSAVEVAVTFVLFMLCTLALAWLGAKFGDEPLLNLLRWTRAKGRTIFFAHQRRFRRDSKPVP